VKTLLTLDIITEPSQRSDVDTTSPDPTAKYRMNQPKIACGQNSGGPSWFSDIFKSSVRKPKEVISATNSSAEKVIELDLGDVSLY
jgi:hypothetical protein